MDHPREPASAKRRIESVPNSKINDVVDEWIKSERDRAILKRRLVDGITYEALAEEFDLSVRRVKTIVYRGMDRLCDHLH